MTASIWETRIHRADELSARYPSAARVLDFYKHVIRYQQSIYEGRPPETSLPVVEERARLEALAELASSLMEPRPGQSAQCPKCEELPQTAVLRPGGSQVRKSLVCSKCRHEWEFPRILCPKCGESDAERLSIYHAEEFPHIRVDACETCKTYLLTVDLRKDPAAVPVVDEIAAIPLNLWAEQQGYTKLRLNLFDV